MMRRLEDSLRLTQRLITRIPLSPDARTLVDGLLGYARQIARSRQYARLGKPRPR
jgi:hypothetical protein